MKKKQLEADIKKRTRLAENSFSQVFRSMQLLNYTVLYYDFDFDKEDIKKFNENLRINNEFLTREIFFEQEKRLLKEFSFSCEEAAKSFPLRSKIKMIGKMPKSMSGWDVVLGNAKDAIETCLLLFLHEFTTTWQKTPEEIKAYWSSFVANSMNYANGMTDEFVMQYFKDEIDLDITG